MSFLQSELFSPCHQHISPGLWSQPPAGLSSCISPHHQTGLQAEAKFSFWTLPSSPTSPQTTSPHQHCSSHIGSLLSVSKCATVFPIMSSMTVPSFFTWQSLISCIPLSLPFSRLNIYSNCNKCSYETTSSKTTEAY